MTLHKKQLDREIKKITKNIDAIFKILDESLSHPAKNFTITYEGRTIDLHHPTTREESDSMKFDRHEFIEYLLKNAFDVILCMKVQGMDIKSDEPWQDIFGVISGEDPADHQFEKYEEVIESSNEDTTTVQHRTIPLNMENYQVKENLGLLDEQINQQD